MIPRVAKLKTLKFTYQGDGKGNTKFFYGAKPMWGGQAFRINRSVAKGFVDEMNTLSSLDLKIAGGGAADMFYEKYLMPTVPRTWWQRLVRRFEEWREHGRNPTA